jgi:hypothetical protein
MKLTFPIVCGGLEGLNCLEVRVERERENLNDL